MGECFYTVLDIPRDADADAVETAYRDLAKTHHPDVSDAPDASDRFKRLTVARNTLADETARARYDRLGHAEYVRQHAPPGLFDVQTDTAETAAERATASTASTVSSESENVATDGGGEWWNDRSTATTGSSSAGGSTKRSSSYSNHRSRSADSIYGGQTTGGSTTKQSRGTVDGPVDLLVRVREAVESLGMWAVVHLLLFGSAGLTAWFVFSTPVESGFSAVTVALCLVFVVSALLASALHLVVTLHD